MSSLVARSNTHNFNLDTLLQILLLGVAYLRMGISVVRVVRVGSFGSFASWNYSLRERGSKRWNLPFVQRFIPRFQQRLLLSSATYSEITPDN
ncbi:MAG: hypothetical protein F6K22_32055 [Okeania sp. SIO2F4]|uniref:hypothetical protein n=1 Tax=Okeania sp. SIO2F4 TaxID=2607790 RepID=UPI001429072E|nr:hypothetical protein [Okeania sp. SIO2F4]NES07030.1 hypothetical protein [Okeania sp. SIO2F4]